MKLIFLCGKWNKSKEDVYQIIDTLGMQIRKHPFTVLNEEQIKALEEHLAGSAATSTDDNKEETDGQYEIGTRQATICRMANAAET